MPGKPDNSFLLDVYKRQLVIRKDKNKDNDDKFIPTIDSDSGEIGTGSNYSGGQQGIRIPGYPSITCLLYTSKMMMTKVLLNLMK